MLKVWGSCLFAARTLLLATSATAEGTCANPDIDGNGVVNEVDFEMLQGALGTSAGDAGFVAGADLDGDGRVSTADYAEMLRCS